MSGNWIWLGLLVVLVLRWLRPWAHDADEDRTYTDPGRGDGRGDA